MCHLWFCGLGVASVGYFVCFVCWCVQDGSVGVKAVRRMYFECVPLFSWMYILEIKPLSVAPFEAILSHSVSCLFVFFLVSFAVQKLVSLKSFSVPLGD